jgi:hypothetical protein
MNVLINIRMFSGVAWLAIYIAISVFLLGVKIANSVLMINTDPITLVTLVPLSALKALSVYIIKSSANVSSATAVIT